MMAALLMIGGAMTAMSGVATAAPTEPCVRFVSQINVVDDTVVEAGEVVQAGWRLLNCGQSAWENNRIIRVGGSDGFGPPEVRLPKSAAGETVNLYTRIGAPMVAGCYRATYQIDGQRGVLQEFGVQLVVRSIGTRDDFAILLGHANIWPGAQVAPSQVVSKGWKVHNCGAPETIWMGYRAVRIAGDLGPQSFAVPPIPGGQDGLLFLVFTTPSRPGHHSATYALEAPDGVQFGDRLPIEILVK